MAVDVNDTYRDDRILGSTTDPDYDDDDPAAISVITDDGSVPVNLYSRFFLQSVSEAESEKYQIVETFNAFYVFFYGKRPPIYRFSGTLLNDDHQNWMNDFRDLYENFLRGTSASEINATVTISYDKRAVSGYLLSLAINQEGANDKGVPFTVDMLVINHALIGFSDDYTAFQANEAAALTQLKQAAAAYNAKLTTGADPNQTQIKNLALNGYLPMALIQSPTADNSTSPPGQQSQVQGPVTVPNTLTPNPVIGSNNNTGTLIPILANVPGSQQSSTPAPTSNADVAAATQNVQSSLSIFK